MEVMNFNPNLIDEIFEAWDHPDTPGCVVGVMQSGELVYARGFGCADLDHGIPLSPSSVVDIGSTSKQFTAACIALLVLDGSLKLEDEIHHWLPEMPDYGTPITVHNVVYHACGLRDHSMVAILGGLTVEDYQDNQTALDIAYLQHGLNYPPGSLHGYTNTNYLLLAEIVKRVSGKSLRRFADPKSYQYLTR
jgi:CubicO group peptidase (beta-lactamase class C family)